MNYPYIKLPGDSSGVLKPYIPVSYQYKNNFTQPILTLIDSGADTSHFTTELAEFFGINWRNLPRKTTFAANGSPFDRYVFGDPLIIELGGNKLTLLPVNFSPNLAGPFPLILGQEGFFNLCRISFERYKWNIDVRVINKKKGLSGI